MYYYKNITRRVIRLNGKVFKPGAVTESLGYIGFPGLVQVPKPISASSPKKAEHKVDKPSSNVAEDITKGGKPDGSNSNK